MLLGFVGVAETPREVHALAFPDGATTRTLDVNVKTFKLSIRTPPIVSFMEDGKPKPQMRANRSVTTG
jgi:hypothetical protein